MSGLTQEALAARLGMALKNFQRIEAGQNLTLSSLERLARALSVEVTDLFAAPKHEMPKRKRASMLSFDGLADAGVELFDVDDAERPSSAIVPVTTMHAAAGNLRAGAAVDVMAWAKLPRRRVASPGAFLARVVGASMEPTVPDGAWVLFQTEVSKPLVGKTVLLARDAYGDDVDAYLLKRVGAVSRVQGATRVVLLSDNTSFSPLEIDVKELRDLRVVAELVRVLSPK